MLQIQTARIRSVPVQAGDTECVRQIFTANASLLPLLDRDTNAELLTNRFLNSSNLPKSGTPEHLINLLLFSAGKPVGLLSVYCGYPKPDLLYIGELFLHPEYTGKGLATETVRELERQAETQQYRGLRVGVSLKNWQGLRFWLRQGFLAVTGMSGDRDYSPEGFAFIELQRSLQKKRNFLTDSRGRD